MYQTSSGSAPRADSWMDGQSAIRGLTQDLAAAFNTGNYDQAAALFTADGFLMAPNHEAVQGPKAIESRLRRLADTGHQNLRLETTRVEQSGDIALEIGRYTLAIEQKNGTTIADRGKFVQTWRRLGVWQISVNCWNSDLPAAK